MSVKITPELLERIQPACTLAKENIYAPILTEQMPKWGIDSIPRVCMFLAQILHESGSLNYTKELASGEAYDTGAKAIMLGNTPEKDGDGQKYKGRGLLQNTGVSNYKRVSKALGVDFIKNPELLETPLYAVMSACWYWQSRNLNKFADVNDIKGCTKAINGGYTHLAERTALYESARRFII